MLSRSFVKKNAKVQLQKAKVFHYSNIIPYTNGIKSWSDIYQKKNMIAVITDRVGSCYLLDYYLPLLTKRMTVEAIVQASERYVGRKIADYEVLSLKQVKEEQKGCLFVVFDIDRYESILQLLKEHGILNVCCSFLPEDKRMLPWEKILWQKKYGGRLYLGMTYAYRNLEVKKRTNTNWRKFQKECKNKQLFLFGAGEGCRQILNGYYFKLNMAGIIDNERLRWGSRICGIEIVGPQVLEKADKEKTIILITTLKTEQIEKQLARMGCTNVYSAWDLESKRVLKYMVLRPYHFYKRHKNEWLLFLFRMFPVNKNKVMFIRHNGKGIGCHEKYIALKMIEDKLEYKIVWLVNDVYEIAPDGIETVCNTQKNQCWQLATAKLWLDDGLKPTWVKKRRNQFYICTHHGTGISLKKFGLEEKKEESVDAKVLCNLEQNEKNSNVWLASSKMIAESYRKAFNYHGEVAITGSPRIDILINQKSAVKKEVRRKLGLSDDARLILYAPTFFRENSQKHGSKFHELNLHGLCIELEKFFGYKYCAGLRLHPLDRAWGGCSENELENMRIMNLTNYPDTQELLLIADILITDYSSIMFDMGYALKKVFLFVPDLDEYFNVERQFYWNLSELPFPASKTFADLVFQICNLDEDKYKNELIEFNKKCGVYEDGMASERVVKIAMQYMNS